MHTEDWTASTGDGAIRTRPRSVWLHRNRFGSGCVVHLEQGDNDPAGVVGEIVAETRRTAPVLIAFVVVTALIVPFLEVYELNLSDYGNKLSFMCILIQILHRIPQSRLRRASSLRAAWVRLRCISSRNKIGEFDSRLFANRVALRLRAWRLTHTQEIL